MSHIAQGFILGVQHGMGLLGFCSPCSLRSLVLCCCHQNVGACGGGAGIAKPKGSALKLRWEALAVPRSCAPPSFTSLLCCMLCLGTLSFLQHTLAPRWDLSSCNSDFWLDVSPAHMGHFPLCTENRIHCEERSGPGRLRAPHRNSVWELESRRSGPPDY